jgi:tetratricopeptide (TPR) repeat protein
MVRILQALHGMSALKNDFATVAKKGSTLVLRSFPCLLISLLVFAGLALGPAISAQEQPPNWQTQVRTYCELREWPSALRVLEAEIARAPRDLDLKTWRARVLTWAGRLEEAEHDYREILAVDRTDPDNWTGMATVCLREGKIDEALRALEVAVQIDPTRADLHAAYARVLRSTGQPAKARAEFAKALSLDPASAEARAGLISLRSEPKNEIRGGLENDSLSYAGANHTQWAGLITRWSPLLSTNLGSGFYQRRGVLAEKFAGSFTLRAPSFAAITAGGAVADDNIVIPKSEAFFDLDRGLTDHDAKFLKGVEFQYGQHWYWYQAARIVTLNGAAILYLPRDWSLTVGATGARSAFSGIGAEWRPSGSTRLGFPLVAWSTVRLSGNILFAAGAENFASVDQIGRFASQTYGGGLRLECSSRQNLTFTYSYQRRTQGRTDSYTGFGYGYRF